MSPEIKTLLIQLSAANMSQHLLTLHDLALYESGDAKLGSDEKLALQETMQLSRLLAQVPQQQLLALV